MALIMNQIPHHNWCYREESVLVSKSLPLRKGTCPFSRAKDSVCMYRGQMNPVFLEEAKVYMEGPTKKMTSELGIDTWEEVGR